MKIKAMVLAAVIFAIAGVSFFLKADAVRATFGGEVRKSLPVYSVDRDDKKIAITFDCAWGTDYTDQIIDAVDKYDVKCTFFAVQFWVEKYPETVKKLSEHGIEIGTHSKTHSHMSKMSAGEIEEELVSSKKAIEDVTGKKVTLFRAPFGEYNDALVVGAKELGLTTIQWDVDSLDWKDLTAEEIATRIIKKVKSGSIILCHNQGLHTAEALPLVFTALKEKGFEFVCVSELLLDGETFVDGEGVMRRGTS